MLLHVMFMVFSESFVPADPATLVNIDCARRIKGPYILIRCIQSLLVDSQIEALVDLVELIAFRELTLHHWLRQLLHKVKDLEVVQKQPE